MPFRYVVYISYENKLAKVRLESSEGNILKIKRNYTIFSV